MTKNFMIIVVKIIKKLKKCSVGMPALEIYKDIVEQELYFFVQNIL